jgi:hypothetical protein
MYLDNYKALCKERSTNAEYPLDLLDGIRREFEKALEGGILGTTYILEKLETLKSHVEFCDFHAKAQFKAQREPEDEDDGDNGEKFSSRYNGGYGSYSMEDD